MELLAPLQVPLQHYAQPCVSYPPLKSSCMTPYNRLMVDKQVLKVTDLLGARSASTPQTENAVLTVPQQERREIAAWMKGRNSEESRKRLQQEKSARIR